MCHNSEHSFTFSDAAYNVSYTPVELWCQQGKGKKGKDRQFV